MAENKLPKGELGYPGLSQYAGQVQEHWVAKLKTSDRKIKVYDEMYRLDPTASAMIKTTSMFMCNSEPRVEAASKSKADIEAAEFVESAIHDMTKSWQEIMSDVVLFLVYGWFDSEIVYWRRDGEKSKFDDGRIGWRKWAPRHPVTLLKWDFDRHGGLQAMVQQGPPNYETVRIPIEKMLHFTTTGMGKNNPEGNSVLEGAYTSYFFARNLTIQEAVICERMAGVPWIKMPEGADDSDAADSDLTRAKKIVRNVKTAEDMGLTLPYGFEFGFETPSGGPAIEPGAVIMRHRRDLARTLMMDFIMLGGGDQGSWAMHKDKSQLYIRSLNSFLKKIADVINRHGVTRLIDLNAFPNITGYPEIYFTPITKIDIGDFSEVIARLFNSGALTYSLDTENEVRREVGLSEVDKPGISFKQPAPLDGDYELPNQEREEEPPEGLSEFSEQLGGMSHEEAKAYADAIADDMMAEYDDIVEGAVAELAQAEDDEWDGIISTALAGLSIMMLSRIRDGSFEVWRRTTGEEPPVEGLEAIVRELKFQQDYIENSLKPDIRRKVLERMREMEREGAGEETIRRAIAGAFGSLAYRVGMYSAGVYKTWANYANPTAIMERIQARADTPIRRDWTTGKILGEGVMAKYVGPADERSCSECPPYTKKWYPSHQIPGVGSLECGSNCRHTIAYKLKGRVYE